MPRWLPNTSDPLLAGRAKLIWATCVGLISAVWGAGVGVTVPFQLDHLTFSAPLISIVFLLTALIIGWWSRYTSQLIKRS